MKIVIQCQRHKQPNAGCLKSADGRSVLFVARPDLAPSAEGLVYARPDELSEIGMTWRQILLDYNRGAWNPDGLYPAWRLYTDSIYSRLARNVGVKNLYILSAGWGLIRADFLIPDYNITFSQSASGEKSFMRRMRSDQYKDFCMLRSDAGEEVVFFGSKSYLPLFCSLTNDIKAKRTVFYKAAQPPEASGCVMRKFSGAKTKHELAIRLCKRLPRRRNRSRLTATVPTPAVRRLCPAMR